MMSTEYSAEMREWALRMLAESRSSHSTVMSAVRHVAGLLGMSPERLDLWQRRYEVDAGVRPRDHGCGRGDQAAAEGERRTEQGQRDPQGCERVFWSGARPPLTEMIRFIDECRDRFGVELICRVLGPAVQGFPCWPRAGLLLDLSGSEGVAGVDLAHLVG